ncbi:Gustatory receptor 45 [Operophtera brumata]|uniref:Gustatory receptor 45 n=1 Tax=Operophtera brumata TaxID=104452 RepID=A0A0L7L099_OPEBR|nr:Gustatory receptor 45 [Operophtera brumata]
MYFSFLRTGVVCPASGRRMHTGSNTVHPVGAYRLAGGRTHSGVWKTPHAFIRTGGQSASDNMTIRKENTAEYLSNDILDEDFVNIFKSIYRLQFMFGTSRVDVRSRFVTPPTALQKCFTLLCAVLTLGSIYVVITVFFGMIADKSVTSLGISILLSIFTASSSNGIHVRFFNGRENSEFYVKMQKLDRLMKIDKCKAINSPLKLINDVSVFLILMVFVSLIGVACISQQFSALIFLGISLCVLTFMLELIACSSIVVYFFVRVQFVNSLIESYLKQVENDRKPIVLDSASTKSIRFLAETDNDFTTSETHIYLKEIFRSFRTFQGLYRFQV